MFDKNYLGHNLISYTRYDGDNDYICTNCGIEIYYIEQFKFNYYKQSEFNYYFLNGYECGGICEISCDDFIIKNIIE